MTRDEVLDEFRSDACDRECDANSCIVDRNMADEIVRLRQQYDALHGKVGELLHSPVIVALERLLQSTHGKREMHDDPR